MELYVLLQESDHDDFRTRVDNEGMDHMYSVIAVNTILRIILMVDPLSCDITSYNVLLTCRLYLFKFIVFFIFRNVTIKTVYVGQALPSYV